MCNTERYLEGLEQRGQRIIAWEVLISQDEMEDLLTAQRQYEIQKGMQEPVAYAASENPDIMYLNEAMKAPDHDQFKKAMDKELKDHIARKHWEVVPRSEVPKGMRVLDMVWAMRHKRHIDTREVYKWKAWLNVHGGQQQCGINYWETYAPVVTWQTIHFFFVLAIIRNWRIHQIDFVLAYTQAPAEVPLYMKFPQGYNNKYLPDGVTKGSHILKLLCSIYGNKAAGRVWNKYLDKGLREVGFEPNKIDPCLYYKGGVILLVNVDDCILMGIVDAGIDEAVCVLRSSKQNFTIEDEGAVRDFLGVRINRNDDGTITLTQPQLIDSIIEDLNMQDNTKPRSIPACSTKLLHKDTDGESTKANFHCRSVIGKLNFLEKSTRPDISVSVHQCTRFQDSPKKSHIQAVRAIGHYMIGTRDKGIVMKLDHAKSFECWVDADFTGNWYEPGATKDPMMAKSWSGWVITYAGCPITWSSKLQTLTALSTMEAKYVALSSALRDQIPTMQLLKEVIARGINDKFMPPQVHCTAFKDNGGAIKLVWLPKIWPQTKHINIYYHHFCAHTEGNDPEITVRAVSTEDQLGDMFTKPLPEALFPKFRHLIMGC